jgi:MOSC domain-containing protein YiiM
VVGKAAKILHLCIGPEGTPALTRQVREEADFVEGKGISGDKKFGKSTSRHVNLITAQSYDWFKRSFGRELKAPGAFGEQVVISDEIDINWLPLGAKLQVGEALLELAKPRQPCMHFASSVDAPGEELFVGHVGIMCRVLKSGKVRVGDKVSAL